MSLFSIIIGSVVLIYTIVYSISKGKNIIRYSRFKKRNELKDFSGVLIEKTDEVNKAINGVMVNLCMPKYECLIDGKSFSLQSYIRHINAEIGEIVDMEYSIKTGELWATRDIPLMKRNLLKQVGIVFLLLLILCLTELFL